MPNPVTRKQCRHIRTSGLRCGSASLRDQNFCYYHQRTRTLGPERRGVNPTDTELALPSIDDRSSIQFALSQLMARILSNTIDLKRAGLLVASLQLAAKLLPPEPRPAPQPIDYEDDADDLTSLVEEFESDPVLGPLAPVADLVDISASSQRYRDHRDRIRPGSPEDPTPDPYGDRAFLRKAIDESRAARLAEPLIQRPPVPDPNLNPDFYRDPARYGHPELADVFEATRRAAGLKPNSNR